MRVFLPRRSGRCGAAALVAAACLAIGASAAASEDAPEASQNGIYCTAARCRDATASPVGRAAGFGVSVLAAGWIARRRGSRIR